MRGFKERMREGAAQRKSRIVLALDLSDPYEKRLARAEEVLGATKTQVVAVKVNHHLLLPFGLEGLKNVVGVCRDAGLPLIADLKLNDIESTNLNAVDSLFVYGFDAVIANPFVGREEGLGKTVDRVHSKGGGILFLVYMSHAGSDEGYGLRLQGGEPIYRVFAERARDWGADGIVVSAKSVDKIAEVRGIVGRNLLIFTPGIGAQGGDAKRSALSGADFLIVGRSIVESADPSEALDRLQGG